MLVYNNLNLFRQWPIKMTALDKDVAVAVAGSGARGVARGVAAKAEAEERTLSPLSPLSPQAAVVAGCESVARTGVVVANLRVAARTAEEMAPHTEGVAGSGSGLEVAPSGHRAGPAQGQTGKALATEPARNSWHARGDRRGAW